MTAAYIMDSRAEAWGSALAMCYWGGRTDPPEYYYEEPFPDCPPDDELDSECEYGEDGTIDSTD